MLFFKFLPGGNAVTILCTFGMSYRVPTAQGKQGKLATQGIWKFCQNTGKTQGIWFAQIVNSPIPKVKHISKFAAKISNFLLKLDKYAKSVLHM